MLFHRYCESLIKLSFGGGNVCCSRYGAAERKHVCLTRAPLARQLKCPRAQLRGPQGQTAICTIDPSEIDELNLINSDTDVQRVSAGIQSQVQGIIIVNQQVLNQPCVTKSNRIKFRESVSTLASAFPIKKQPNSHELRWSDTKAELVLCFQIHRCCRLSSMQASFWMFIPVVM